MNENELVEVGVQCNMCKDIKNIPMTKGQLTRIQSGEEKIQDIIPEVSPGERELFISKICGSCFDKMFGM